MIIRISMRKCIKENSKQQQQNKKNQKQPFILSLLYIAK